MSLVEALGQFLTGLLLALFNFVMTALITAVQLICWPLNTLITSAFPDISAKITAVVSNLASVLNFFPYVLSWLPPGTTALLLFILGVEVALLAVFQSSFAVAKVWRIVQRIKFW